MSYLSSGDMESANSGSGPSSSFARGSSALASSAVQASRSHMSPLLFLQHSISTLLSPHTSKRAKLKSILVLSISLLLFIQLVALIFNLSFFSISSSPLLSSGASHISSSFEFNGLHPINDPSFYPNRSIAVAIPVGGRTERSNQLNKIVRILLGNGVPSSNIFIFEDVQSRIGRQPSAAVAAVAQALNIQVVHSEVVRYAPEGPTTYGLHLARHYKFMLDWILSADTDEQLKARLLQQSTSQRKKRKLKKIASSADQDNAAGLAEDDTSLIQMHGRSGSTRDGPPFEFALIIEDDLELSADFVHYFFEMSKVLRADDSLYCIAAHQDNAFPATSATPSTAPLQTKKKKGKTKQTQQAWTIDPLQFEFRRGNHFMAPGWMTSRRVYETHVKDNWLDDQGEYKYKEKFKLPNGHWDRFFDSQIHEKDCLFPELPRITHQGEGGFTVTRQAQLELYGNLQLAQLAPNVSFGDLHHFTKQGYIANIQAFIAQATRLNVLEESLDYQNQKLVYVLYATSDADGEWNAVLSRYFGIIGVGGYGGWSGYAKVRGIFQGTVFVRWNTNLILITATYSPFMRDIQKLLTSPSDGLDIHYEGCYADVLSERTLPHFVKHYTRISLSPQACLNSCTHLGYKYAGVQHGEECWCGHELPKAQVAPSSSCHHICMGSSSRNPIYKMLSIASSYILSNQLPCGGELFNSIYSNSASSAEEKRLRYLSAPAGMKFIKARLGESCTAACLRETQSKYQCAAQAFPYLHRNCAVLSALLGCSPHCIEELDVEKQFVTPGLYTDRGLCALSEGKHINCEAAPFQGFQRACVCEKINKKKKSKNKKKKQQQHK